ncbi:hypothetical protein [Yersinia frederiksenii]|uniref:Uncharacterized protein n=1 Tax=Yersinia frederiksenii TaxID=29484 RepID=A0AAI8ZQ72_YERFR|nr:hypothetical protein [Yersinia frederiksenii]CFQ96742.1 Uncharacterised protein [Yersinia frederiksenii]
MTTSTKLFITNENDFHEFIKNMMGREDLDSDEFQFPDVEFKGWPTLDINVKGDKKRYNSSLTASMLFGMSELTNEIQRAFAVVKYGSQNLQRLTNPDKQRLDIVYHISEGSSQADGDSDAIVNGAFSVLKEAIGKMTGRQALCAVIAMTIVCGGLGWKFIDDYWETQRTSSSDQVSIVKTSTDAVLQSQKNILEILSSGQTATSREVIAHGEDGRNKLLKNLAQDQSVETVKLGDETVSRDQLNAYNQRQSIDRVKVMKEDDFYVKGVTRTGPTNQDISITVTKASTGETFIIKTSSDMTSMEELKEFTDSVAQENILKISYVEVTENNRVSAGQLVNIIH